MKKQKGILVDEELYKKLKIYCILTHQEISKVISECIADKTKDLEMPRFKKN